MIQTEPMDKSKNKKYKYNQRIVSELCKKYNVEADTVRKSLRGATAKVRHRKTSKKTITRH